MCESLVALFFSHRPPLSLCTYSNTGGEGAPAEDFKKSKTFHIGENVRRGVGLDVFLCACVRVAASKENLTYAYNVYVCMYVCMYV